MSCNKVFHILLVILGWYVLGRYLVLEDIREFNEKYQYVALNLTEEDTKEYTVYRRSPYLDRGCQYSKGFKSCDYMEKWKKVGSCSTFVEKGIRCRGVYNWIDDYGYQAKDVYSKKENKNHYPRSIVFKEWRYNVTLTYTRMGEKYQIHLTELSESENADLKYWNKEWRYIRMNDSTIMNENFGYVPSPHLGIYAVTIFYIIFPCSVFYLLSD